MEQVLTTFSAVVLFWYFAPQSIEAACFAAMILQHSEPAVVLADFHLPPQLKAQHAEKEQATGVLHGMFHVAVPACTLSSAARSFLSTAENLSSRASSRAVRAQSCGFHVRLRFYYRAWAMPMLYFPSSFLTSFASLLIPKTARNLSFRTAEPCGTSRSARDYAALQFSIFCSGIFCFQQ